MFETTEVEPPRPIDRITSLIRTGPKALILRFIDQFLRQSRGHPVWSLSRVRPFLYIGGQHRSHGWQAMEAEGITSVLNLREVRYNDATKGIGGKTHLHLPTRDNTPISFDNLNRAADFIAQEVQNNGKVFVHCGVGVGRAPIAAAAYLIKYEKLSATEALAAIQAVRPFVHPTSAQKRHLEEFAKSLNL